MICYNCKNTSTDVTNSRPHKKQPQVWRRRTCSRCGSVFTTLERPQIVWVVQYPNDAHQPFNIGILILSIAQSFQHDPALGKQSAFDLAETVVTKVTTSSSTDKNPAIIAASRIAQCTYAVVKRYDSRAGLVYALQHNLEDTSR